MLASESTANPPSDPYKSFPFRVKWEGRYVAGVRRVSGLDRTTQGTTHQRAGDPATPRPLPGQSRYPAITLERGVTYDGEFDRWANKLWVYTDAPDDASQNPLSLADFRKSLTIELYNEAGQLIDAYIVYRCWVSEYQTLADLDGNGTAIAIQMIKLENEGWERDLTVAAPPTPDFHDPPSA